MGNATMNQGAQTGSERVRVRRGDGRPKDAGQQRVDAEAAKVRFSFKAFKSIKKV